MLKFTIFTEKQKDADTVDTSNMVLGINEYYKDTSDCNSHTNYNIYKKFTQRVINETGFQSREWLHTMNVFEAAYKRQTISFQVMFMYLVILSI